MAALRELTPEELQNELDQLENWTLHEGKLHCELRFASFVEAFGFMTSVALVAESQDHHPEWFNVYNRVVIDLTTHDVGGISQKDIALARAVDEIARGRAGREIAG